MLGEYSMSTTLTNGLKLPDKGSVDWYADMQSNYAILDGAVGTIAEHTSALAGKAPLVHTHTKSDITDFPAYGNAAGTICEGNDSRLSDARTPVAHIHGKADITDLLNSDFIPSANNSYDLGSSSYQWNNLYAKNYYYNGVAWGLDKENAWAGNNSFYKNVALSEVALPADCTLGFTGLTSVIFYNTRGSSNVPSYGTFCYIGYSITSPYRGAVIKMVRSTDKRGETNNGYVPDTSFNLWQLHVANKFFDFMEAVRVTNNGTENSLKPITDNATDLGTSTNKWKTLNGINPGALSLPNQDVNSVNLSGNITVLDGSASNDLTQTVNGWLFIYIKNTTGAYIRCYVGSGSGTRTIIRGVVDAEQSQIYVFFPIYANITVSLYVNATSITRARFYPCLGNV